MSQPGQALATASASPSLAPAVAAEYPARVTGIVFDSLAPGTAGASGSATAYRVSRSRCVQRCQGGPVEGALVYLMTPDERLYLDTAGKAVTTTTDASGHYELPASVNQPLVVTALLPQNRRLVGYTLLSAPGTFSVDVTLESTYVTEFLRDRSRRQQKALADYDLSKIARLADLTRAAIEADALASAPDLSLGGLPDLVADYLVALSSKSRELSDAWADLLGSRPYAATRLDDFTPPGHTASGVAVRGRDIYVASFNDTEMQVSKVGSGSPLFEGRAHNGLVRVDGMAFGPDGQLYFVQSEDRRLGGAVDRTSSPPAIRLFVYSPATEEVTERRLTLPSEIAPYMADATRSDHVRPFDLDWHDGNLYVGDFESSLIFSYPATSSFRWPGEVFAGLVENGYPRRGYAAGGRREVRFGPQTHIGWHGGALYATDTENSVLRRILSDGSVEVVAGKPGQRGFAGDGGPPGEAMLDYPKGFVFDAAGRLFLADGDNERIRLIEGGRIRTIAGGGKRNASRGDPRDVDFGMLTDLAWDPDGNLLVVDWGSGKVWRLWLQFGL